MVDRTRRELADADIQRIADTYHAWRGEPGTTKYAGIAGFCKATKISEIAEHGYVLTPGRYVGSTSNEGDDTPFSHRFAALKKKLEDQLSEGDRLNATIRTTLGGVEINE